MNKVIAVLIIVLGIGTGLFLYFSLFNEEEKIFVVSYDGEVTFELAEMKVKSLDYISRTKKAVFVVEDPESFINVIVLGNPNYLSTYHKKHTLYPNSEIKTYIFLVDGYYFMLYQDLSAKFILSNMSSEYQTFESEYYFPFIVNETYGLLEDNLTNWDTVKEFNNFDSLVDFYKGIDENLYQLNQDDKTIFLKCFDINNELNPSKGYPIKLSFSDNGISIEIIESEI